MDTQALIICLADYMKKAMGADAPDEDKRNIPAIAQLLIELTSAS